MTEKLEVVIIELEKITEMTYEGKIKENSREAVWNKFFLNPKGLGGKEMEENRDVREARIKYDELIGDYAQARLALSRKMAIMEKNSLRKEGREEGIEEGLKQGREQGKTEKQKEIAKKMLLKGKDIQEIMEFTELSKEEIEKLK